MPNIPTGAQIQAANTVAQQKTYYDAWVEGTRDLLGAVASSTLTIDAGGSVTPTAALHTIATNGGAGTDNLDNITATNMPSGRLLLIFPDNAPSNDVVVRHNQGGTDDIQTLDSASYTMDQADKGMLLEYDGTQWVERIRIFGNNAATHRTFLGLGTAATQSTGTGASNVPQNSDILGKHTIWVPVSAMDTPTTNPAGALTATELSAGNPLRVTRDFASGSSEELQFSIGMPKNWDNGTVDVSVFWTYATAGTGTTVKWDVAFVELDDNSAINSAFGTEGTVTDTKITTNDLHIGDITGVATSGSSSEGLLMGRIRRDGGTDSHSEDAGLMGLRIKYTIDALNDD